MDANNAATENKTDLVKTAIDNLADSLNQSGTLQHGMWATVSIDQSYKTQLTCHSPTRWSHFLHSDPLHI